MFEKEAEEYAKINALKGLSYRQITETYDEISGYPYFLEDKIKQVYLAGVEAGRPKWHKVADGDLPKEEDDYFCCLYDKETKSIFYEVFGLAKRYADREDWYVESMLWTIEDVIAWCEIPKFEV